MDWTRDRFPDGRVVYTSPAHRFQTDALRLAAFAMPADSERVCDLGTGCGSIPLRWLWRGLRPQIDGVDKQPEAIQLAAASAAENGWDAFFHPVQQDWEQLSLPAGAYDRVVCNPPYYAANRGGVSADPARRIARQDAGAGMNGWIDAAARLLRHGGRLCLCYRPERTVELLGALRRAGLEPKRMQWVQARADARPRLLLCEARKGGRPGLVVEPVLLENEHKEDAICPER